MKPTIEKTYALLACTECGAEAYASCNCRKAYKPVDLAAKAIAANPSKSNRAIAAEIDVSEATVRRARGASPDAPDEHTGLDGKTYPAKQFRSRAGLTGIQALFHRSDNGEAPEPVEQVELADSEPYDPAADEVTEATIEEMLADPATYWLDLIDEATDRLRSAFHAAREARSNEDHAAEHQALCDLIAAASEIKKFYEDHDLLAGRDIQ